MKTQVHLYDACSMEAVQNSKLKIEKKNVLLIDSIVLFNCCNNKKKVCKTVGELLSAINIPFSQLAIYNLNDENWWFQFNRFYLVNSHNV